MLITGIGTLIIIYTGYYFANDKSAWRFLSYLFLFMGSMLGLVLAGDVITLFIFWEATSITSFLLVAKYKDEAARRGAFKALFITGGGGIALLAGLLFVSNIVGSTEYATILNSGDLLRNSEIYLSRTQPRRLWCIHEISTISRPHLVTGCHECDTGKRFPPQRHHGQSRHLFDGSSQPRTRRDRSVVLAAQYRRFNDDGCRCVSRHKTKRPESLVGLLNYFPILGILMMLIGQDTEIAFKALIIGIVAHALYKSSLFMSVGIIDHETGTRLLSRLGGLRRAMLITFVLVVIAALSLGAYHPCSVFSPRKHYWLLRYTFLCLF